VWTRTRRAKLAFRLPQIVSGPLSLYVQLKAPPATRLSVRIGARASAEQREIDLVGDDPQYMRLIFNDNPGAKRDQEFIIEVSRLTDLGDFTDDRDKRTVGCGLLQIGVCPDTDLTSRIAMLEAMTFSKARPAAGD
jgi:hypothetical protein